MNSLFGLFTCESLSFIPIDLMRSIFAMVKPHSQILVEGSILKMDFETTSIF